MAIMLAGYHSQVQLLGISTVASNQVNLRTECVGTLGTRCLQ